MEIILDGMWECGLAEIHYPLMFYNVVNNELAIRKAVTEPTMQQKLPQLTVPNTD